MSTSIIEPVQWVQKACKTRVLVIQPETTISMMIDLRVIAKELDLPDTWHIDYYTPTQDRYRSYRYLRTEGALVTRTSFVISGLINGAIDLRSYNTILVACYGAQPQLISWLRDHAYPSALVMSIFDASMMMAFSLLPHHSSGKDEYKWGVVTVDTFWEGVLRDAVDSFLSLPEGMGKSKQFAGIWSSGLQLSDRPGGVSNSALKLLDRINKATWDIVGEISVIIVASLELPGLEVVVWEAVVREYGEKAARHMHIIDGVKAGFLHLKQALQAKKLFHVRPSKDTVVDSTTGALLDTPEESEEDAEWDADGDAKEDSEEDSEMNSEGGSQEDSTEDSSDTIMGSPEHSSQTSAGDTAAQPPQKRKRAE